MTIFFSPEIVTYAETTSIDLGVLLSVHLYEQNQHQQTLLPILNPDQPHAPLTDAGVARSRSAHTSYDIQLCISVSCLLRGVARSRSALTSFTALLRINSPPFTSPTPLVHAPVVLGLFLYLLIVNKLLLLSHSGARAPRGGVTRQGVVLTDLQSLRDCQ